MKTGIIVEGDDDKVLECMVWDFELNGQQRQNASEFFLKKYGSGFRVRSMTQAEIESWEGQLQSLAEFVEKG